MRQIRKIFSKRKSRPPIDIEKFLNEVSTLNPEEFEKKLEIKDEKDLPLLGKLVTFQKSKFESVKRDPKICSRLKIIKQIYQDLIHDGYLRLDFSTFGVDTISSMKLTQSREEIIEKRKKLDRVDNHFDWFRLMNGIYSTMYENICNYFLRDIVGKIKKKSITKNAVIIEIIKKYKNRKYEKLLGSLIPQIRNSISHKDFYIDKKQPLITFYDFIRKNPPLTISKQKYEELFHDLFFLELSFDIALFELRGPLIMDIINHIEEVSSFVKKHKLKLRPKNGALSIYEIGEIIKKIKIEEKSKKA